MTSRDFCYWLQGYFEIYSKTPRPPEPHGYDGLNSDQVRCIQQHLALVFKHEIDPSQGTPEHQAELQKIHDAKSAPKIGGIDPVTGMVFRC